MTQLTLGTRVTVTALQGGLFYSGNKGKHGTVTRVNRDSEVVHVRFDDGVEDYGRFADVQVIDARAIQVGSKVIVTAEDGGVFLRKYKDKVGEVYRVDGETVYVQFEDGRDYGRLSDVKLVDQKDSLGFISNEGNTQGVLPVPRGTLMDVLYNDGTLILDIPVGTGASKTASNNANSYSATSWRGVGQAGIKAYRFPADRPGQTLESQLASLRAELDAIKAEKTQAEAELATAQAKVDGIETRRIALVGSLTKHGIQFIGEAVPARTAQEAFDADELEEGMTLLCVTPYDTDEHTAGKSYKIVGRDVGDEAEFRLESDDGYGYWLDNEGLVGFTVVA